MFSKCDIVGHVIVTSSALGVVIANSSTCLRRTTEIYKQIARMRPRDRNSNKTNLFETLKLCGRSVMGLSFRLNQNRVRTISQTSITRARMQMINKYFSPAPCTIFSTWWHVQLDIIKTGAGERGRRKPRQ